MNLHVLEEEEPRFQIAPLIDVFFLVLIFFITASVFYQIETEIPVELPVASSSESLPRTEGKIIINIDKEEKIIINGKEYNLSGLEDLLKRVVSLFPNQAIIIRGDRKVNYGRVIQVLDVCKKVGVWNISFATLKEKE